MPPTYQEYEELRLRVLAAEARLDSMFGSADTEAKFLRRLEQRWRPDQNILFDQPEDEYGPYSAVFAAIAAGGTSSADVTVPAVDGRALYVRGGVTGTNPGSFVWGWSQPTSTSVRIFVRNIHPTTAQSCTVKFDVRFY